MYNQVIGIDPGLNKSGWCVLDSSLTLIDSGLIKTSNSTKDNALLLLYNGLSSMIKKYKPEAAILEDSFVNNNLRSSLTLAQARGCIILTLKLSNLNVYEYSPRFIKKCIVGYGNAKKEQVAFMVQRLVKNIPKLDNFDISDAIAIAACYYFNTKKN